MSKQYNLSKLHRVGFTIKWVAIVVGISTLLVFLIQMSQDSFVSLFYKITSSGAVLTIGLFMLCVIAYGVGHALSALGEVLRNDR